MQTYYTVVFHIGETKRTKKFKTIGGAERALEKWLEENRNIDNKSAITMFPGEQMRTYS